MPFLRALVCVLLLAAPQATSHQPIRYEASHRSMGTVFTVAAYGPNSDLLSATVNAVFEEVDRLDAEMSNYKPESELSEINRDAARQAVLVSPNLLGLLQESFRLSAATDGAFDITVGPLMKAWGFFRGQGRVPSAEELHALLGHIGYQHVKLSPADRTVRFDEPGIELDMGGIAKGYAVMRAVEILRENGISSAFVSAGNSSIYALGAPPRERGWKINLRDPYDPQKSADVVYLKNFAVSTSGNYEKFFKLGGKSYSHIMNPHTGMPVEGVLSVAVFDGGKTAGDGISASLYVLGVERSRKYLATHPNITAIFYLPAGGPKQFRRVLMQSPSYHLPADALVDIAR